MPTCLFARRPLGQTLDVGHKEVVARLLDLAAQLAGHLLPSIPARESASEPEVLEG